MIDVLFGLLFLAIVPLILLYLERQERIKKARMIAYDNSPEANQKRMDEYHFKKIYYELTTKYGTIANDYFFDEAKRLFLNKYSREYVGPFEYNKNDDDYFNNKGPLRIPLKLVKLSIPNEVALKYHATMSCEEFINNGYANSKGVDILINPKGNKHPKGYFMAWKDNEGVSYSGDVSTEITSLEEFTDPVISIISHPDSDDMFVLIHNRTDSPTNKFVKRSIPKKDELTFLATMSVAQFIESGYAAAGTIDVIENPRGNTHPTNLFISWKDKEGVGYSGAVSNNIASVEEITDPVLSIVSTVGNKDMFVLLHNKHDAPAANFVVNFK